ncbi:MAG: acyltransferase family protein [Muribaculaceae bacterium]|nr:acyltransferase family protein [Muribaculaceae bacterium]
MTNERSSIVPKKVRDSNMELLRLVAMLLVLVVHANFRALPVPGYTHVHANPSSAFLMFLTEAFSIYGVDLFVMLSGWYGIRFKATRLAELLFQVLFFGLFAIGICAIFAPQELSHDVFSRLLMLGQNDYWFVKTYIALYLLSPVLNAFVEQATRRQLATVLIGFFAFQFIYGWAFESTRWLVAGYSLPSFISLYLLARFMRLHPMRWWQLNRWADLGIYLVVVAVLTVAMFVIKQHAGRGGALYFYICPLVILGSMHLLLFFSKLSLRSRVVNWLAISAFGAYLTQSSSFIGSRFYDQIILGWFNHEPRLRFIILTGLLIVSVFLGSILIDKVRLVLWKLVQRIVHNVLTTNRN